VNPADQALLSPPKLAADEMLGRLATWLRVLGLDTIYLRPGLSRVEKRLLGRGRVFLTRAEGFGMGQTLLIRSNDPQEQLAEAVRRLGLRRVKLAPLSRCLRCNEPLASLPPQEAAGIVPAYVAASQSQFGRCPACGRVFWPGSHHQRMIARLKELIEVSP